MVSLTSRFSAEVHSLGDRVHTVESSMSDMVTTINDLVEAHEENIAERHWLKAKIANLEDRSRRNNLTIRGIPESVQSSELHKFAQDIFLAILPGASPLELTIDRIHRVPKPPFLPPQIPCDVLLRVHFYQSKEAILSKSRSIGHFPGPYANIEIFVDLSKHTLDQRRQLSTITKALRNHNIPYKWKHASKIVLDKDGTSHSITSLERGIAPAQILGHHTRPTTSCGRRNSSKKITSTVEQRKPTQQKGLLSF